MTEQIERIVQNEELLDEATAVLERFEEALELFGSVQQKIKELDRYYGSEEWRKDFEDDEAGQLPKDLKRGVLSEDGIYDILTKNELLLKRCREL